MTAGHDFDSRGYCRCGRKWLDIRHWDDTHLDAAGYAHVGNLNRREVDEIVCRRAAEDVWFGVVLGGREVGP
jgi:hypothetical protein